MASTAGLVPITRHFLAKYYEKYPYSPLNKELPSIIDSLKEKFNRMDLEYQKASGNKQMMEELQIIVPHKIDENLWKNREQIEEILHLFEEGSWPKALKGQSASTNVVKALERLGGILKSLLKDIEKFQVANSDRVYNMVLTYMPQDFRCSLIKQQRERSEKRRQAEVEALVNAGGSIREKFVLLWKQQMERRRQLAQLGSGSGLYKQLVKFLVGVPLVLLEFVKQINDHQGPMEEQRERYGPPLYQITTLASYIRIFTQFWWLTFDNADSQTEDMLAQLEKSVDAYVTDFKHYLKFMGEVFENSPFLISAEEAGLTEEKFDDFEETPIPPGKFHEVAVKVECEGSIVAWDFRLTSGKDVGFHVDFINESGSKVPMVPYKRYEANQPNQGDFPSPFVGHYKLVWDNSYSTFYRKIVRHKLDVIPPVAPQSPDMSLVEEDEQT
ncbi:hypothetical protein MPTK1_6g20520 [Marchantia polymorpha subsp. ruderalis]|uniref:GOLD domain-containing protein n=2 Tax=Marchantia polymorpha TaxID=3197 RepID=A0AAF6BU73_MARPO|nr:hypothetical protein MARPO_0045s0012 [Marchantia polymorpha]BBN15557.1 hypothetical protein Mp_6g20520 [Marchantia polymorpha subsp. ruderalis]|eukprot:PTQ39332.1 hypothetical protein MARPO_0045s0012 [Marchantia polymorpha]